ncbi:MAG: PqqD family peptide modification chaperone, partial [Actinobacteria bacterium]|nr:PqqD family protein [Actinomycetota bacterium]NIX54260.1 PqqD family peptide modification chaperone [Actinomycetota bacterium]
MGGATVLFHVGDRRLHVLNPTAGAVWSELDPDGDVTQLARRLGERFGVTADGVLADVERLLEQLAADGLLVPPGGADPATATGAADRPASHGDA